MTTIAAGILIRTKSGKVLYLKRSSEGDMPGMWAFPGGKCEEGEDLKACAVRETLEETGFRVGSIDRELTRSVRNDVDYTTFIKIVDDEFTPKLNEEHTSYAWVEGEAPQPLHPGCAIAVRRETMHETDVAKAIANHELASPQRYENMYLFAMRITGTGLSYRKGINEFVWRKPENYLTPEFVERCAGLPVILMHPTKSLLNSQEFSDRIVGTMLYSYIEGDEVWGVARIYDADTVKLLIEHQVSTSPAVLFRKGAGNMKGKLEDGSTLLVEGEPSLIDHLALCEKGVWDKGEEPIGVRTDNQQEFKAMASEHEEKKEDAKKDNEPKMDADAGTKLDKVLKYLDSFGERMDAMDRRMDAMAGETAPEALAADKKKDSEEKEEKKDAKKDSEKEEKKDAKKDALPEEFKEHEGKKDAKKDAKKDSEEKEEKKDAEKEEKMDRQDSATIADLKSALSKLTTEVQSQRAVLRDTRAKLPSSMSDSEYRALLDEQARFDEVYNHFGKRSPRPLEGESVIGYKRRAIRDLQGKSTKWKGIDLSNIPDEAFGNIEGDIFADAVISANSPDDLGAGELREIVKLNASTGQRMIEFKGKNTFIAGLRQPTRQYCTKFDLEQKGRV